MGAGLGAGVIMKGEGCCGRGMLTCGSGVMSLSSKWSILVQSSIEMAVCIGRERVNISMNSLWVIQ